MQVLIVGGGVCGTSAAETLRKLLPECTITIIGDEPYPLYSRVLLPHYVCGRVPRERVFLKTPAWYETERIELISDTVAALNVQKKTVQTTAGRTYHYDKLLIAGGGTLKALPFSEDPRAHHFQTVDDADRIYAMLASRQAAPKTEAHVFGGGFIAMEFLNLFVPRGFETHVHLRSDQFFYRSFSAAASRLLQAHFESKGVIVHTHNTLEKLPDSADVAGIGVGLSSQFPWVIAAKIDVGHGICVNEFLETNVPDIYAAGDCAEYQDVVVNRRVHIGNWMNAQMQGRHVASVIAGNRTPYRLVSSYSTHALGVNIIAIGDAIREAADQIIEQHVDEGGHIDYFVRNNVLVGAVLVNTNTARAEITKNIGRPFSL